MLKRLYINDLKEKDNEEIEIQGYVDNIRNLQWVQFLILRDRTGKVQITIEKSDENNKEMVEIVNDLTLESTIKVTGKIVKKLKRVPLARRHRKGRFH